MPARIAGTARTVLSVFVTLLLLSGCSGDPPPLTLALRVDLNRYAGRWYMNANIPYFAERGNVRRYFDISFQLDGRLADVYSGRSQSFDAPLKQYTPQGYVVPDTGNARWRESPF
jgi:apolipoprotein D and lipocalin family protein